LTGNRLRFKPAIVDSCCFWQKNRYKTLHGHVGFVPKKKDGVVMADLIIVLADRLGQYKQVRIDIGANTANVAAFLTAYKTYTDAKVMSYSVVTETVVADDDFAEGTFDLVDEVMRTTWKLPTGEIVSFSVPAPKDEAVDADEDLTSDAAEDWGDALKTLLGVANIQFRGGRLYRKGSNRPKKLLQTGV